MNIIKKYLPAQDWKENFQALLHLKVLNIFDVFFACLVLNIFAQNLKSSLSYGFNRKETRVVELYLNNRIARQGQLFSTSFTRPLLPSESNNIESQILGKRFLPDKVVGMKGVMDYLMPLEQRLQHTGSLTMLFPAINISLFGPIPGLVVSILMCLTLSHLLAYQMNSTAESLYRYKWLNSLFPVVNVLISLLLFKYFTSILFRGDLANFLSPYFVSLSILSILLNRRKKLSIS